MTNQQQTAGGQRWWLSKKGTPAGPYDANFILDGLRTGKIPPDTFACLVGGKTWKRLNESNTFAAACPAMPAASPAVPLQPPAGQAGHGPAVPPTPCHLDPCEYRVAGEGGAKAIGIAIVVLVMLVFIVSGLWFIPPFLILAAAIGVWIMQGQLLGQAVKVSPTQFPDIDEIAEQAAARLGMERPEVFLKYNPTIGAFAWGFLRRKSVILHSALVEAMDHDELLHVVGHEFSHVKCGHTTLGVLLGSQGGAIPLISPVLNFVFLWWSRKAEYTCDRGGLIACRNPRAAALAMCKVAVGPELFKKMNMADFLAQQQDLDQNQVANLSETLIDHPYTVRRIHAIQAFHASPEYSAIASRSP
jgi:Zn-dependent protease with chaperone function